MDQALQTQADSGEPQAVTQGRMALSKPLAHFAGYEFVVQCPTPACRYRRVAVARILARHPGLSVADAIDKLRCQPCRAPVAIAGLARANASYGEHWLLLRGSGLRWR